MVAEPPGRARRGARGYRLSWPTADRRYPGFLSTLDVHVAALADLGVGQCHRDPTLRGPASSDWSVSRGLRERVPRRVRRRDAVLTSPAVVGHGFASHAAAPSPVARRRLPAASAPSPRRFAAPGGLVDGCALPRSRWDGRQRRPASDVTDAPARRDRWTTVTVRAGCSSSSPDGRTTRNDLCLSRLRQGGSCKRERLPWREPHLERSLGRATRRRSSSPSSADGSGVLIEADNFTIETPPVLVGGAPVPPDDHADGPVPRSTSSRTWRARSRPRRRAAPSRAALIRDGAAVQ
jgi:hypothetical protein